MKKVMTVLLCALNVAFPTAFGNTDQDSLSNSAIRQQIPNPFVDCDTLDAAAAISGFTMIAPETMEGYSQHAIQAVKDEMVQIFYLNGEDEICIRKAVGTEDISGDYNEYAEIVYASVGDIQVSMRGNTDMVNVATWAAHGYTYAININGDGLTTEAVRALIATVN